MAMLNNQMVPDSQADQAAFLAAVWHRICRWFPIGTFNEQLCVAMVSASCSFPSNAVMVLPALRMGVMMCHVPSGKLT